MAGLAVGRVVGRGDWFWPVSRDVVVAVDIKWFLFLVCERVLGTGLSLALAADSSQPLADLSLALPDSSLFGLCGLWGGEVTV